LDWVISNGLDNTFWLYLGRGDGTANLPTIIPLKGLAPLWVTAVDLRGNGTLDLVVAEADSGTIGVLLGNGDGTFQAEVEYQLPVSPLFVLGGDFNSDGKLDIAVGLFGTAATGPIAVLPGDGQGHLGTALYNPAVYPSTGQWLAAADFNGDGRLDLMVVDPFDLLPHGGAQVYLNNGNGTFSAGQLVYVNGGGAALSAALADLNGDGCVDAIVADNFGFAYVYTSNCNGTFNDVSVNYALGDNAATIQLVDLNRDGNLDIVTTGVVLAGLGGGGIGDQAGNLVSVLLGDGKGHFSPGGVYRGEPSMFGMAVGDLNGDGFPDVVTANQGSNSATVFLNDGKGGFGDPQGEAIGYNSGTANSPDGPFVIVDVDGNGTPDIVFLQLPPLYPGVEQITSLLNDGTGKFSAPIRSPLWNTGSNLYPNAFVLADFRNTGRPDALVLGGSIVFAPNLGGGKFGPYTMTGQLSAGAPLAVGDFNGDGKLDFISASFNGDIDPAQYLAVFLGNGDGTFRAGQSFAHEIGNNEAETTRIYAGDFNRDGKLDVLVLQGSSVGGLYGLLGGASLYELLGNGDGTFQPARLLFQDFGTLALADVNHDGWPDIVALVNAEGYPADYVPTVSVFLGQPDGSFAYSQSYTPYLDQLRVPFDYGGEVQSFPFEALLADFNGDGNPDLALFQTPAFLDQSFVQILYGNRDGTFTPTYAAYGLNTHYVPEFAVDLNGDGRADLIEQDNLTSSFNVLKAISGAPALQLQILNTPLAGGVGYGTVTLTLPSSSETTVVLTASDPNVNVPNVIVPAGSVSQDFQFSIGAGFNPAAVFSVQGQVGSATAIAYGYVPSMALPVVGMEPTAVLFGGTDLGYSSGPLTVTVKNIGNAPLNIKDFSVFEPEFTETNDCGKTVPVGGSCNVQVTFLAQAPGLEPGRLQMGYGIGAQAVDLEGFGLGLEVVPEYSYFTGTVGKTSPAQAITVTNQGTRSQQITILPPINGFSETNNCTTLNGGASCQINATFTPTQSGFVTGGIQIKDSSASYYNSFGASLSGTGTGNGIPPDFGISSSPGTATVTPGQPATYDLSISSMNGFAGTVDLTCSVVPSGPICSMSANSVNLSANQIGKVTVSVSTMAASTSALITVPIRSAERSIALWTLIVTVLVGGVLCRRHPRRANILTAVFFLVLICSCGGGGSSGSGSGSGSGGGTPKGTYTIAIKGVSGPTSHTMNLMVIVQ